MHAEKTRVVLSVLLTVKQSAWILGMQQADAKSLQDWNWNGQPRLGREHGATKTRPMTKILGHTYDKATERNLPTTLSSRVVTKAAETTREPLYSPSPMPSDPGDEQGGIKACA